MNATEPVTYIPLEVAAICVSCEALHVIADVCPGCGSDNVMALARWIGRVNEPEFAAADAGSSLPAGSIVRPTSARRA